MTLRTQSQIILIFAQSQKGIFCLGNIKGAAAHHIVKFAENPLDQTRPVPALAHVDKI